MRVLLLILSGVLWSQASYAEHLIKVQSGTEGDLQETRLYAVDFKCSLNSDLVSAFSKDVVDGFGNAATVNLGVSIYSQRISINTGQGAGAPAGGAPAAGAPAAPAPAGTPGSPASNSLFSVNLFTQSMNFLHSTSDPVFEGCSGQFFISGNDNYKVDAQVASNTTNTAADVFAKLATLTSAVTTSAYALIRTVKSDEFDKYANKSFDILTKYEEFRALFAVSNPGLDKKSGALRVGDNWVRAYQNGVVVAQLSLRVKPVISLVNDGNTKFLSAYAASADPKNAPIDTSGSEDAIHNRCVQAQQPYIEAGIRDDRDLAYLLYRRLIAANPTTKQIAQCLGRNLARAALTILAKLPAQNYKITQKDIDNLAPDIASDQPHDRDRLATEVSTFVDLLGSHLQSDGLRGARLSKLQSWFASKISVEDTTRGYKAIGFFSALPNADKAELNPDDLLSAFRRAGIGRWGCVQRTKRGAAAPNPTFYDADIDSAVIIIAAKATGDEELDFNKTQFFGVHLKFNKAAITEPLKINALVFEDKWRDAVVKASTKCMSSAPGAGS